jgi:hypothetical protein
MCVLNSSDGWVNTVGAEFYVLVAYFHGTLHLDIVTSSAVIAYLVCAFSLFVLLTNSQ